jgi:hypothetical protein
VAYVQSTAQDAIQINTPDRMDIIQSGMGTAMNLMASRYNATAIPPVVAGTLSPGAITDTSITYSIATNSAGTPPYSNQLQIRQHGTTTWNPSGSGVLGATATLTASGLTAGTGYDARVLVSDSASVTSTSNTITTTTTGAGGGPTPPGSAARPRRMGDYRKVKSS